MMFGRLSLLATSVLALAASSALAGPIANPAAEERREVSTEVEKREIPAIFNSLQNFAFQDVSVPLTTESLSRFAFNGWGGFNSLHNFDNFFGLGNFDGRFNNIQFIQQQQIIVVQQCRSLDILILQQHLAVLFEVMKQLVLTQICEVEVQTIIVEQFRSRFNIFSEDIRRVSGRGIGFDSHIASFLPNVVSGFGNSGFRDLGFGGRDIGSRLQFVGSNWSPSISPSRVRAAWQASQLAILPAGLPSISSNII